MPTVDAVPPSEPQDTVKPAGDPDAWTFADRVAERVAARRWLLAVAVGLFVVFSVDGSLSWLQALAGGTAMLIAAGVLPRTGLTAAPVRPSTREITPADIQRLEARQWRGLLNALIDPAVLVDRDAVILAMNPRAKELLPRLQPGVRLTSLIRDPDFRELFELVPDTNRPLHAEYVERGDVERRLQATAAWLWPPKDTSSGNQDQASPPAVLVTIRDLSEREQFARARSDFISYASHELRTPLASLMGFIETLQGHARDDHAATDIFLDRMATDAERMNRLIDDLTRLSTLEMKMHMLPTGRVDLAAAIEHVVDTLDPLARDAEMTITMELEHPEAPIRGDVDDILQALTNVVSNAIRYGRAGGHVNVSLQSLETVPPPFENVSAPAYMVAVRDDGPGIDRQHLPRLTERFYRVDVAESRAKGGTGLGLALVKHAIQRHRADMRIESVRDRGTTVSLVFSADHDA